MSEYSLTHLSDHALRHDFFAIEAHERATTARWLAHLAEFDARRMYLPEAYPSMYAYCVGAMHLSEETACRRIRVARVARSYPQIFEALSDGRVHMTAVVLLAPHLTRENVDELLAAGTHKSRSGIERFLAERFPRPDLPTVIERVPPSSSLSTPRFGTPAASPSPATVTIESSTMSLPLGNANREPVSTSPSPGTVTSSAGLPATTSGQPSSSSPSPATGLLFSPPTAESHIPQARVTPLSASRVAVHVTLDKATHDLLCEAEALLGDRIRHGDVAEVLHRALTLLVERLRKQKFAATHRPRPRRVPSGRETRHIPAEVKRAVWKRDGGQCTFVSEKGHRCESKRVEFDHVTERARGGRTTVSGVRLRCRAHNQYTAERTFGAEFMRRKRESRRKPEGSKVRRHPKEARAASG